MDTIEAAVNDLRKLVDRLEYGPLMLHHDIKSVAHATLRVVNVIDVEIENLKARIERLEGLNRPIG